MVDLSRPIIGTRMAGTGAEPPVRWAKQQGGSCPPFQTFAPLRRKVGTGWFAASRFARRVAYTLPGFRFVSGADG